MKRLIALSLLVLTAGLALAEALPPPVAGASANLTIGQLHAMARRGSPDQQIEVAAEFRRRGDLQAAIAWYLHAADQGSPKAQYEMGLILDHGSGLQRDFQQAFDWMRKAAVQGYVPALPALAIYYNQGLTVPNSPMHAAILWRRGAELGDVDAQYSIGKSYFEGRGLKKNVNNAAYWWRKAAAQGSAEAYFGLGAMLLAQKQPDRAGAYFYFSRATQATASSSVTMGEVVRELKISEDGLSLQQRQEMQDKLAAGVIFLDVPVYDPSAKNSAGTLPPMPDYVFPFEHIDAARAGAAIDHFALLQWRAGYLLDACKKAGVAFDLTQKTIIIDWLKSNEALDDAIRSYNREQGPAGGDPMSPFAAPFKGDAQRDKARSMADDDLDHHRGAAVQYCTDEIGRMQAQKDAIPPGDEFYPVYQELIALYGWR